MKTAVLGSGSWGTALAMVLLENGNEVTLWSHNPDRAAEMAKTGQNPRLPGVSLPSRLVHSGTLDCARDCGAVVLATPSYAVRQTAHQLAGRLTPGTVVVSVSKGIERESGLTLTDVIAQELGEGYPIVALCGPSHAEEVARGIPTALVSASRDQNAAELVQDLFMNERLRIYTSPDIVGVEIGAALKNVIALCAGCSDGMGFGDNTKAALMTRGLTEIARLGVSMGGREETFAGLTGVGDLIVTCTSVHSRNRRFGILLGRGVPVDEALTQVGAVVEGYYATANAWFLARKAGVEMPITHAAYQVLYESRDPREVITELMTRAKKHEIEESWV